MIQFQNEYVVAELVNNSTVILLTWKGFIPSAEYREALDRSLEIAKTQKISKWISDLRLMKVIRVNDQEWASTDWLSRAVLAGCYSKQAVIMADDVFAQASAQKILTTVQNKQIEIQNFTKIEEAKTWLA